MIIERELYKKIEPLLESPEAIVITGMHRVGKTTLLQYIYNQVKSDNKLFIDLENPANQLLFNETNYERISDNLKLFGLDPNKKSYVFLDEIQLVKNIPAAVKYLMDHYQIKFFMSGSASFYLKNLFSESLAGRKYLFELFPLSFGEFLRLKSSPLKIESLPSEITPAVFEQIDHYYSEYLQFGAFPGVVQKENIREKKLMIEDIFTSYFQQEVALLADFRKSTVVRDLIFLLMERIGSTLEYSRLATELGINRQTVLNYIDFLESTYFISRVPPFHRNRNLEIRKTPKCYLCDTGLARHFSRASEGALFENSIFNQIRTKGEIHFYRKKSGVEIDFLLNREIAYEVKLSPSLTDLKKLKTYSESLGIGQFKLVSRRYSELQNVIYGFQL
ncbi:MAG: ATP-binding protein [Calditrichia bacterium]